jgi:hypothetical protein
MNYELALITGAFRLRALNFEKDLNLSSVAMKEHSFIFSLPAP